MFNCRGQDQTEALWALLKIKHARKPYTYVHNLCIVFRWWTVVCFFLVNWFAERWLMALATGDEVENDWSLNSPFKLGWWRLCSRRSRSSIHVVRGCWEGVATKSYLLDSEYKSVLNEGAAAAESCSCVVSGYLKDDCCLQLDTRMHLWIHYTYIALSNRRLSQRERRV